LTRHPTIDNSQWKYGVGVALAAKWTGANVPFAAVARLKSDGKVEIWTSLVDVGEGIYTGIAQIAAETLKLSPDKIVVSSAVIGTDSMLELPGTGPSGSRQLYHCGNAVILACRDLRKAILELAARQRQIHADELDLNNGFIIRSDTGESISSFTDLFAHVTHSGSYVNGEAAIIGRGFWLEKVEGLTEDGKSKGDRVVAYYTPAATGAEVKVNAKTGELIVERLVTAVDAGRAINPLLVEGQIIGSGIMGLGYALSEELHLSEDDGGILNPNLVDYKPPYAADSPEFVPIIIEHPQHTGPFGARGVGEAPILAVAPAIANAVFDALGIRIRSLPLTSEKIFTSLKKHSQS
jgi:CO/xanthine dehydrogenase Mo-binding subunit